MSANVESSYSGESVEVLHAQRTKREHSEGHAELGKNIVRNAGGAHCVFRLDLLENIPLAS